MRTVKIKLNTQTGLITHQTEARTWGELKGELSREYSDKINFGQRWKVVVREDKTVLELDEAILPTASFILFFYPAESKAGISAAEVDNLSYNEARKVAVEMGVSAQGTAGEIRQRIISAIPQQVASTDNSELVEQIEELREHVNAELTRIAAAVNVATLSGEDLAMIQREFDQVKRNLGL